MILRRPGARVIRAGVIAALAASGWSVAPPGLAAPSPAPRAPLTCLAEALGGIERIARVSSLHARYEFEKGGLRGTREVWHTVRGAERESLDVPGVFTELVVFDGRQGWRRGPNGVVLPLSGADLEHVVTSAYLGSYMHLVPGRLRGAVERLGADPASGQLRLAIRPEDGTPVTLFLDPATCLPARLEQPAGAGVVTITYADWRDVRGIRMPHSLLVSDGQPANDARLTLIEARLDAPLPPRALAKPAPAGPRPRLAEGGHVVEVPFDLVSSKPFLEVRVQGVPMRFLYDTGSPGMMIDRDRAEALGLPLQGRLATGGAGEGALEQAFANRVDFAIGGLEAPGMSFTAASLKGSSPAEGCELSGLVGQDLASHFVVNVDYAARRFRFHDPARFAYAGGGAAVPYSSVFGGLMAVAATIALPAGDSVSGRFIVDTGVRLALVLNRPFAEKHRLAERLPAGLEGAVGYGLGGESRGRITRAKSLRLGGLVFPEPVTVLSLDRSGALASADFDGIIGGELLRRCNVFFDHPGRRMILEPNEAFAAPFDYDMSGAFLLAQGEDFRHFLVWRLLPGSPAQEAGLLEGDVITRVEGRPASELTLEEIRAILRGGEREVVLEILRGEQPYSVRIRLRRLV